MKSLIVFIKNPIPGAVKTRLQTRYAPEQVAALYAAFVRDVLERAESVDIDHRVIAFDPPDAESEVRVLCGDQWQYIPQAQADLGTRMHNALMQQLHAGQPQPFSSARISLPSPPTTLHTHLTCCRAAMSF